MKNSTPTDRTWKTTAYVEIIFCLLLLVVCVPCVFAQTNSFWLRTASVTVLVCLGVSALSVTRLFFLQRQVKQSQALIERMEMEHLRYHTVMACTKDVMFEYHPREDLMFFFDPQRIHDDTFAPLRIEHYREKLTDPDNPGGGMVYPDDIPLALAICAGKVGKKKEIRISTPDTIGRAYYWHDIYCAISETAGHVPVILGIFHNIHEQKTRTELLQKKSEQDSLTHLYNKEAVNINISEYLSASPALCGALLIIDLDNFKQVNDYYGHQAGDRVLEDFAHGLRQIFRASDILGRIGGDEFLVCMKDVLEVDLVEEKAARILTILDDKRYGIRVTCSIGIALFPNDGKGFDLLFSRADRAMYTAKQKGKRTFCFYHDTMAASPLRASEELIGSSRPDTQSK